MSRTPKGDVTRLPKWVQNRLTLLEQTIDILNAENEELNGYLCNMEATLERQAIQEIDGMPVMSLEEFGKLALTEGTTLSTVDL